MNLAHIGLAVSDIKKSKDFYAKALAPLGLIMVSEKENSVQFGGDNKRTKFYIHTRGPVPGAVHIAFEADTREQVRNFYDAAIAAGAKGHGAPGIREHYSPNYYAAFVIDPDDHNLEAVCRNQE